MLELIILPTLIGLGLAWELFSPDEEENDNSDDPVQITLGDGVVEFQGTDQKEHVQANDLDNILNGSDNNDLIGGLEGADTLAGEEGDDRLFGGAGPDQADGGQGNDRIFLGDGDDISQPTLGGDEDAGDDFIRGGAGNDWIADGQGSNQIFGDIGHDNIFAIDGLGAAGEVDPNTPNTPDEIHAGYGNDTLIGDAGDILTGGIGEDRFVVTTPSTAEGAPAVLTDFDIDDDMFSVVFLDEPPEDPTIQFTHDAENDLLRANVGGQEVATLSGLSASDIPFLQTFVTTLPELMADEALA